MLLGALYGALVESGLGCCRNLACVQALLRLWHSRRDCRGHEPGDSNFRKTHTTLQVCKSETSQSLNPNS